MIRKIFGHREIVLFLFLLVLFVGFSIYTEGFLDWFNLFEQARYLVVPGMVAVAMTFIIATAGIDLSVGSLVALCGMVLGLAYQETSWPIWAACIAAVGVGALGGLVNGGVSSFLEIPPLVVTLATMTLFRGIAMGLSKGAPVGDLPEGFTWLSLGDIAEIPVGGEETAFVPVGLIPLGAVMLGGWLVLRGTWMGRYAEAIGENEVAAEFSAMSVRWSKCGLYVVCGIVCGVASIWHTALYATAKADTAIGLELEAIACVVVGGTRISGGRASVLGTLLGLLIIGILQFGLVMSGMRNQHMVILVGILVIVAAVLNEQVGSRRGEGS